MLFSHSSLQMLNCMASMGFVQKLGPRHFYQNCIQEPGFIPPFYIDFVTRHYYTDCACDRYSIPNCGSFSIYLNTKKKMVFTKICCLGNQIGWLIKSVQSYLLHFITKWHCSGSSISRLKFSHCKTIYLESSHASTVVAYEPI